MKKLFILSLVIISSLVTNVQAMEDDAEQKFSEKVCRELDIEQGYEKALKKESELQRLGVLWVVRIDIEKFLLNPEQGEGTETNKFEFILSKINEKIELSNK